MCKVFILEDVGNKKERKLVYLLLFWVLLYKSVVTWAINTVHFTVAFKPQVPAVWVEGLAVSYVPWSAESIFSRQGDLKPAKSLCEQSGASTLGHKPTRSAASWYLLCWRCSCTRMASGQWGVWASPEQVSWGSDQSSDMSLGLNSDSAFTGIAFL